MALRLAVKREEMINATQNDNQRPSDGAVAEIASAVPRLKPRPWSRLTERARLERTSDPDAKRAMPLACAIALLAILALWGVSRGDHRLDSHSIGLALTLVLVGLVAELLSYNATKAAAGSIALMPFAAAALLAPTSFIVVAIIGAEFIVQLVHRRFWLKSLFNLAQFALGISCGIIAYRLSGGFEFSEVVGASFFGAAQQLLLPTTFLVAAMLFVNTLSVSAAIAVTSRKSLFEVWFQITRATTKFSFLLVLLAFYLTWMSSNLGIAGTAGLLVPMLAVRQLYRTTVELTNVTEELLDLMVATVEARDPYTSGHSKRVSRGSEIIARALGLSDLDVERVSIAALLHDVGKIDEKFAPILAKEGRLTPDEWVIMKMHPIRSAELAGKLTSLRDIVPALRHHHENWDGTGYPDGLQTVDIPMASRIIMFADTLDAITTDRPYRKALGIEEARAEFLRFRGKQFDPTICDTVVRPEVWAELYTCFGEKNRQLDKIA